MAFGTPLSTSIVDKVDLVDEWIIKPELEFEHLFAVRIQKNGNVEFFPAVPAIYLILTSDQVVLRAT
jgi:hypothetical protein